jgi:hypothetical protein
MAMQTKEPKNGRLAMMVIPWVSPVKNSFQSPPSKLLSFPALSKQSIVVFEIPHTTANYVVLNIN